MTINSSHKNKRSLIIGDVHGCYDELILLLKKANYDPSRDVLYFVGDMINKGPRSKKVLEFIYQEKAFAVLGNHELALLRYHKQELDKDHQFHQLKLSLGDHYSFWAEWISSLPSFIETDEFFIVHGGKIPHKSFSESDKKTLCTIRTWDSIGEDFQNSKNPLWYEFYKEKKTIIYGHHAAKGLTIRENVIGLDSGCVYGRKLSLISFPQRKIYQVKAKKAYFSLS